MADDGELSGSGNARKGGCSRIGIGKLIAFDIGIVGRRPSPVRESGGRINRKRGISGGETGIIDQGRSIASSVNVKARHVELGTDMPIRPGRVIRSDGKVCTQHPLIAMRSEE